MRRFERRKVAALILVLLFGVGGISYLAWWENPKNLAPQVLFLTGSTSYAIGKEYGQEAQTKIQGAADFISSAEPILNLLGINGDEKIASYLPYVPQYLQDEMKGVADGAGVPLRSIQAENFFPEIFIGIEDQPVACSQFIKVNGTDGDLGPIYGRTLDFPPDSFLQNFQVVLVINYPGQVKLIGHTVAGMVGFLTGMNDHGLSVGISQVTTKEVGNGTPVVIEVRDVLQNNSDVPSAVAYLTARTSAIGWNYALADKSGNAAVFETTHDHNNTRWVGVGGEASNYICATNAFHSATMAPYGPVSENSWIRKRSMEYALNSTNSFTLLDAIHVLRNSTDPRWNVVNPSPDTINRDFRRKFLVPVGSLFAMITVPAHGYALVACGLPGDQPFYAVNFEEVVG